MHKLCSSSSCVDYLLSLIAFLLKKKKKIAPGCVACSRNDRGHYIWYQSGFNPATVDRHAFHCHKPLSDNLSLFKTLMCPCGDLD
jgi:hypothetical protein